MNHEVNVKAWVAVRDDCQMQYHCLSEGKVEVGLGERQNGFDMLFTRVSLARLAELAAQALQAPPDDDAEPVVLTSSTPPTVT